METINYCESELCQHRDSLRGSGLVSYSLRASLNTSYCVLLRSQHPSCLREDTEEAELPAYCALQVIVKGILHSIKRYFKTRLLSRSRRRLSAPPRCWPRV